MYEPIIECLKRPAGTIKTSKDHWQVSWRGLLSGFRQLWKTVYDMERLSNEEYVH